jgi:HPt (histidine-containing phosphotransfer) domain-containing protein
MPTRKIRQSRAFAKTRYPLWKMSASANDPKEIQERLRKRYLDRLSEKMRRMRRDLLDRDWMELRSQCKQVRSSSDTFGFPEISELAQRAETLIPENGASRAASLPEAREALDALINAMDTILVQR